MKLTTGRQRTGLPSATSRRSRSRSRSFDRGLLRADFDATHHFLLHHEVSRLKHKVMDKPTKQAWLPVPAPANDETRMVRVDILEKESPKPGLFRIPPEYHCMQWLADEDRQRRRFRMEPDFVRCIHFFPRARQ